MDRICPRCGTPGSKREFAGSFCVDCRSSMLKLDVPRAISIPKCKLCGKVKLKGGWFEQSEKRVGEFVLSLVKGKYSGARVKTDPPEIAFTVNEGGSFLEVKRDFALDFPWATCTDCSRKTGGYFEAIIQLRGDEEKIRMFAEKLTKRLDITKIEELKEGLDLYAISKTKSAYALAKLGLKFTVSNKLFGLRDGPRIYRTTFCVRVDRAKQA